MKVQATAPAELRKDMSGAGFSDLYIRDTSMKPSFEQVFENEHKAMIGLAYLLLHSESQAEEAVQDAFVKLLDRFDTIENPGGFLRVTTLNRCRDLIRRRNKEDGLLSKLYRKKDISNTDSSLSEFSDVLAVLSFERRQVVVLKYFLGHQPQEIAQFLEIPEGTVRSRLHRGLQDLKEQIQ